jgi:hypothetical protein
MNTLRMVRDPTRGTHLVATQSVALVARGFPEILDQRSGFSQRCRRGKVIRSWMACVSTLDVVCHLAGLTSSVNTELGAMLATLSEELFFL